jgi:pilus assembly protein FimV
MKFARQCCQLLLLALLSPTVALALGLGDIHLKSTLDAPLDADIDLVDVDVEDLASLKATLATRDTFKRLGADYPSFLGEVTLTPERTADGHTFLHVHSANVANEPFATLMVEVDWARGHLVREYTVLLDPPVFNSQSRTNPSVAAPAAGASARSGAVDRAAAASGANANSATTGAPPVADTSSAANATASNGAAPSATVEPSTSGTASTPAASSAPSAAASGVSAPSAGSAPATSAATASKSAPPAEPAARGAAADTEAGSRNYTVKSGDTLSSIAAQTYGSDRATQMRALVAIYRANPAAFHSNMNVMYAGRVLKLPGDSELEAIGPGEAVTEVRQQYASWHGGSEQVASSGQGGRGQLRLVAPQEGAAPPTPPANSGAAGASAAGAGSSAATAALQQRVQQLEAQLAESQRLLQMRNADLAALQARVQQEAAGRQNPTGATAPANAPPRPPVAATQPPAPAVAPPAPSPAVTAPTAATPPEPAPATAVPPLRPRVANPPRVATNPAKSPRASAPAPSRSVLDLVSQYWYALVLLIGVLIAVFAFRWVRSRQEDAFDRSLGELSQPTEAAPAPRSDTLPVRAITPARQEPSYEVEESGTHQRPIFEQPIEEPAVAAAPEPVAVEEAPPAEAPVALDQGDPLAEADFHMAYGLYDQAAELVQIAITREPKRRDLKMKLLEVFFVWGNRERFLQTAKELAASRDQAPAGEWEKILIMGRQIAPEDPLFADSRALAGAAKMVDLNLEGGQNRVDFDLLGEPSLSSAPQEAGVELDLGAALGDPSATAVTGESPQLAGSDVDFVLDEGHGASDATGTTREMPGAGLGASDMTAVAPSPLGAGSTETLRIINSGEAETPTVEQPAIHSGDHGTIRQKIDAATRSGMMAGEQTAELAIDDLGLDLSALEGHTDETALPVDADAPTLLADLDEGARRVLEKAEPVHEHEHEIEATGTDATLRAPAPGQAGGRPTTTGTWMFTDTDFGRMAPNQKASPTQVMPQMSAQPQHESGSTSAAISALRSGDLDLDLGSLGGKANGDGGLDLDIGAPSTSGQGGQGDTQRLKKALVSDDMSLPDLEPVTLSEVGTKLDLARAYMDMGDPEGARSILSEVMSEGSVSQKQEARRLMEALPG